MSASRVPTTDSALTPRAPWVCRRHRRAGLGSEPTCCDDITAIATRTEWFHLRLARMSVTQRLQIDAAIANPRWSRDVLAAHVRHTGKTWSWLRNSRRRRPTSRLR